MFVMYCEIANVKKTDSKPLRFQDKDKDKDL